MRFLLKWNPNWTIYEVCVYCCLHTASTWDVLNFLLQHNIYTSLSNTIFHGLCWQIWFCFRLSQFRRYEKDMLENRHVECQSGNPWVPYMSASRPGEEKTPWCFNFFCSFSFVRLVTLTIVFGHATSCFFSFSISF